MTDDLSSRLDRLELAVLALARLDFGDFDGHPFRGNQYTGGSGSREEMAVGTEKNPIPVKSAIEAVKLIAEGKFVAMPADQVSIALDEIAKIAREAQAKGEKAPTYDLCKITVPDTNLFCVESKGIPRINMPQLSGEPLPDSPASKLPKNEFGEVDITDGFRARLAEDGFKFEDVDVPAATLKATQNELNGAKVAGIMDTIESGKDFPGRIFVSSDGYVVDGHHRWAANVGIDYNDARGGDVTIPVTRVDMPISVLLKYAAGYAAEQGIPQQAVGQGPVVLKK